MGWLGLDDTDHLGGGCTTWTIPPDVGVFAVSARSETLPSFACTPWPAREHEATLLWPLNLMSGPPSTWHAWLTAYWKEHLAPLVGQVTVSTHAEREQVQRSRPCMVR